MGRACHHPQQNKANFSYQDRRPHELSTEYQWGMFCVPAESIRLQEHRRLIKQIEKKQEYILDRGEDKADTTKVSYATLNGYDAENKKGRPE
jgi:hypothetical protein